jgi:hypothetical protein
MAIIDEQTMLEPHLIARWQIATCSNVTAAPAGINPAARCADAQAQSEKEPAEARG